MQNTIHPESLHPDSLHLARVHAVLAAGVEQPRLLEQWREQPALLRALGVAPEQIDLAALGKFAGLSIKVRHNLLRPLLPLTFRLMSVAAIEIEIFSAYAAFRSRHGLAYAGSVPARARDLIEFLGQWLDLQQHVHRLLWDTIRYEDAVARLGPWYDADASAQIKTNIETSIKTSIKTTSETANTINAPRIRGDVLLHVLHTDMSVLDDALHASTPDLLIVPHQPQHLCFWRAANGDQAAVMTLDVLGYYLLSLLNGQRSIATLARRLGGGRGMTRAVVEALQTFSDAGIVALPPRKETRACS